MAEMLRREARYANGRPQAATSSRQMIYINNFIERRDVRSFVRSFPPCLRACRVWFWQRALAEAQHRTISMYLSLQVLLDGCKSTAAVHLEEV